MDPFWGLANGINFTLAIKLIDDFIIPEGGSVVMFIDPIEKPFLLD